MSTRLLISEPSFLMNILNPIMVPCLESGDGGCQDAMIAVDVLAVTLKLLGAFDGTERFQMQQRQEIRTNFAHGLNLKKCDSTILN